VIDLLDRSGERAGEGCLALPDAGHNDGRPALPSALALTRGSLLAARFAGRAARHGVAAQGRTVNCALFWRQPQALYGADGGQADIMGTLRRLRAIRDPFGTGRPAQKKAVPCSTAKFREETSKKADSAARAALLRRTT
jgi:hypothetical protein